MVQSFSAGIAQNRVSTLAQLRKIQPKANLAQWYRQKKLQVSLCLLYNTTLFLETDLYEHQSPKSPAGKSSASHFLLRNPTSSSAGVKNATEEPLISTQTLQCARLSQGYSWCLGRPQSGF
jgi:hypothetical protein